jgi:hypothetical protein
MGSKNYLFLAVSLFEYNVLTSVPDFQTKPADSWPAPCRIKNGSERWKKCFNSINVNATYVKKTLKAIMQREQSM